MPFILFHSFLVILQPILVRSGLEKIWHEVRRLAEITVYNKKNVRNCRN